MSDRNRNPGWIRPDDWPYDEDYGSEAWKERMAASEAKSWERRKKWGFIVCPECKTGHTNVTLTCRGCSYKVDWKKLEEENG